MVPKLVHDRDQVTYLDAVLPIILPPQDRRTNVVAPRLLPARRAA